MARRASSNLHSGAILGVVVALVALFFAGRHLIGQKKPSMGDVEKLDVRELLENGNSLRGNEYVVEGKIDQQLRWTTSRGQVVSVRVNTPSGDELIGVEIPPSFGHMNIERQQRYAIRVKFRQGGVPVATAINRL
jgi:hypothetical protein